MRRVLHLAVFGVALLWPAVAMAGGVEVRVGAMFPNTGQATPDDCETGCNLFADLQELFGASKNGWTGATGGIELSGRVAPGVELGIHVDGYGTTRHTRYGSPDIPRDLRQNLELAYAPLGLSVRVFPLGARAKVAPYVAAGPDIVFWQYQEHGDYYDSDEQDAFSASYEASGVAAGLHVAAGLRVPISYDFAITGEARYLWSQKVHMEGDYTAYDIQPRGVSATVGLHLRF